FYAALLTWALYSWFWSRVLLERCDSPAPGWFRRHGPRILGVLPPLIVAAACFFIAPRGYSDSAAGHPKNVLFLLGWLAVLLAILLYIFFILRRRWVDPAGVGVRIPAVAVLAVSLFSVALLVLFFFQPVTAGLVIGSGAIVCLAA